MQRLAGTASRPSQARQHPATGQLLPTAAGAAKFESLGDPPWAPTEICSLDGSLPFCRSPQPRSVRFWSNLRFKPAGGARPAVAPCSVASQARRKQAGRLGCRPQTAATNGAAIAPLTFGKRDGGKARGVDVLGEVEEHDVVYISAQGAVPLGHDVAGHVELDICIPNARQVVAPQPHSQAGKPGSRATIALHEATATRRNFVQG